MATPCVSFTTARDRNSQIRSTRCPWGLPDLPARLQSTVRLGNALAKASLRIFRACLSSGTAVVLENPATSRLFLLPAFKRMLKWNHVRYCIVDMCQFGTRWRKPTGLLTANVPGELLDHVCTYRCTCRSTCSRTNLPHLVLSGNTAQGVPWTKVAQTYPKRFCVEMAKILTAP